MNNMENIEPKETEKQSMRNAEAQSIHREQSDLFYQNIPLFMEKRNMILNDPRLYGVKAPKTFYSSMYVSTGSEQVTLGELLNIWENEEAFTVICNKLKGLKKCGGKAVVYFFGGSPLSGSLFEKKAICTKCGNMKNNDTDGSFGNLRRIRGKYSPIEPIVQNPASIEELVAVCKGENFIASNEKKEISVVEGAETFVKLRGKKFNNQEFFGMLSGNYIPKRY
jgi:hypothetical protein